MPLLRVISTSLILSALFFAPWPSSSSAASRTTEVSIKARAAGANSEDAAEAVAKLVRQFYAKNLLAPKARRGLETECGRPSRNVFRCEWWILYGPNDKKLLAAAARDGEGKRHLVRGAVMKPGRGQATYIGNNKYLVAIS